MEWRSGEWNVLIHMMMHESLWWCMSHYDDAWVVIGQIFELHEYHIWRSTQWVSSTIQPISCYRETGSFCCYSNHHLTINILNEYVVIFKLTWTPEVLVGVACFVLCCRSVWNAVWVCRRPRDVKYCWEDNERSGVTTENYESTDLISNIARLLQFNHLFFRLTFIIQFYISCCTCNTLFLHWLK